MLLVRLFDFRVLQREYLRRKERRIPRPCLPNRHRRHRNPSRHLHDSQQRIQPIKVAPGSGTPIIGSVVQLAITPGRCAAIPAPAIITSSPLSLAVIPYSRAFSGVLCADMKFSS